MDAGAAGSADPVIDAEVLIVGCGPVGAALANLLGQAGVRVLVLERNRGILPLPRAVHVDGEVMRIFQTMGLAPQMLKVLRPGGSMHWVNAQGDTLLVRAGISGLGPQGWHNNYYYHQPQLEEVLRAGMRRFSQVVLREQIEVLSMQAHDDRVAVQVRDHANGAVQSLCARYVVGCDGARSTVRRWVGGDDFEDLGGHQTWVVVDALLSHPLDLPEHSVQHCDPSRPVTSIYVQPLRRRWELMVLPGEKPEDLVDPERIWAMLRPWVRPTQATLERAACYTFHSLIARNWQRGRAFLAGDAAHQTPPFLGQGLCAGLRDVSNLAWKLALALRHPSGADALLRTYGPERLPHVREFIAMAVQVGRIIQELDPQEAARRDERLKAEGVAFHYPTPRLGPGWHRGEQTDAAACVGRISIQHTLEDGRWLDDVVGQRFAVVLSREAVAALPPAIEAALTAMDVAIVTDAGARLLAWLKEQGAVFVVLRPDRYVFDAGKDLDALPVVLEALQRLRPAPPLVSAAPAP